MYIIVKGLACGGKVTLNRLRINCPVSGATSELVILENNISVEFRDTMLAGFE